MVLVLISKLSINRISQISEDEKFGSYYYIVQYFTPKPLSLDETGEQQGKAKSELPDLDISIDALTGEQQGKAKRDMLTAPDIVEQFRRRKFAQQEQARELPPTIWISFYDRNEYLLWSRFFLPAYHAVEENKIDGGWEWKSRVTSISR